MKIDQDYLKELLEAFEAAEKPTTDIEELQVRGFNYEEDKFLFHLQILGDQALVEGDQDVGLGYERSADGIISWAAVPLRLTANGHELRVSFILCKRNFLMLRHPFLKLDSKPI